MVKPGTIIDGILAAAQETGADLIVLYRHASGGLGRKLLGSVSDQVIRRAAVPVLLIGETAQTAVDQVG
jgi:nucleotide-binding universal stress UspA family protein